MKMAKKKTTKSQPRKNAKQKNLFQSLVKWGLVAAIWGGLFLAVLLLWYSKDLGEITQKADFTRRATITVIDANGATVGRYGDIKGNTVTVDEVPDHLIQAVLATEDRRFYKHPGIDILGIFRAALSNLSSGGVRQGGSTITQQLAKNLFLTHERTYKRKIQEAMLALWLEHQLTKDEILSAYLNRVYLGGGTYGVDAAAKLYFGKPVENINLLESAILAGLLKAPSRYSPHNNPELSQQRAQTVLNAMVDAGYITEKQADNAAKITFTQTLTRPLSEARARYFTDWVISGLDEIIGTVDEDLTVYTTLDMQIQAKAEDVLSAVLNENQDKNIGQGALLTLRPDGAVIAMVGGRDYNTSQFNRVIQAQRQPGSSFKPVVYLTALEQGIAHNALILDAPFTGGEKYKPQNFGNKYYGEVTLVEALTYSMNTATVRLMKEVGVRPVIDTARKLGIFSPIEPDLSSSLGSSALSPAEMTTAYAVIANGGYSVFPYAITKIESATGELYYARPQQTRSRRVFGYNAIRDITAMMQSVVQNGTGRGAALGNTPVAGKTGTSQNSRDAWFIGFTDSLITGVWVGNDDNSPMAGVTGGSIPARIWRETMQGTSARFSPSTNIQSTNEGIKGLLDRLLNSGSGHSEWPVQENSSPESFELNE